MSTTTEPLGGAQLVNPHISVVVVVRGWPGRLEATRRTANPRDEQRVGVLTVSLIRAPYLCLRHQANQN